MIRRVRELSNKKSYLQELCGKVIVDIFMVVSYMPKNITMFMNDTNFLYTGQFKTLSPSAVYTFACIISKILHRY